MDGEVWLESTMRVTRKDNGDVDGVGSDLIHRLAFGLGDLLLGQRGATRDIFLGLLLGLADQQFRLVFRCRDDVVGFLLGFLALALVFRQEVLRFLAQPADSRASKHLALHFVNLPSSQFCKNARFRKTCKAA